MNLPPLFSLLFWSIFAAVIISSSESSPANSRYFKSGFQTLYEPPKVDPVLPEAALAVRVHKSSPGQRSNLLLREDADTFDYADFEDMAPMLRTLFLPHSLKGKRSGNVQKRYLGIDIPEYISSGGRSDALKSLSDKMKAMG